MFLEQLDFHDSRPKKNTVLSLNLPKKFSSIFGDENVSIRAAILMTIITSQRLLLSLCAVL